MSKSLGWRLIFASWIWWAAAAATTIFAHARWGYFFYIPWFVTMAVGAVAIRSPGKERY